MTVCVDCGVTFAPWSRSRNGSVSIRCNSCYNAFVKARPSYRARYAVQARGAKNVRNDARMRALRAQVFVEETACGFCGLEVDKTLPSRHRMAPTLDHILPLALGGAPFDRDNVRLSHLSCNARAGASMRKKDAERASERAALARAALWLGERLPA